MLDRLIKISSLSGAFLIFCGVLKLIIYYSQFNINIIDFLNFSEIITSFLDDVNILLIYASIMLVVTLMTMNILHKKAKISIEELLETLQKVLYLHRYKYVLFFFIIILTLLVLIYFNIIGYNYYVIYSLVFCTIQLLTYLLMTKDENEEIDIPSFSLGFSVVLTIIFSIFLLAKHDIQVTNSNKYPVNISTSNLTVECNLKTKNIYLGKTDNYVFLKIDSTNSCIAIPISEIKKFEFK